MKNVVFIPNIDLGNGRNSSYNYPKILCVGHTPQFSHPIVEDANLLFTKPNQSSTKEKKTYLLDDSTGYHVLRLDTGSSRAFGKESKTSHRRPQVAVLSMNNDGSINVVIKS